MKRWLRALGAAAALALAPLTAMGAIDATHHDPVHMGMATQEKCAYCHSITLASTTLTATYGAVGNFCMLVCHDGSSRPASRPASPGYFTNTWATAGVANTPDVVAFSVSHGASITAIPDPDVPAQVGGTGWPHTAASGNMECTSCHAVHDGTNPPFLNAPMATGDNGTAFCNRCHDGTSATTGTGSTDFAGRYQTIATMGAHPTEFAYSTAAGGNRGGDANKLGRSLEIKAAVLRAATTVTTKAAFNASGVSWETGGHFYNLTSGLPVVSANDAGLNTYEFGCYSCHSAHAGRTSGGTEVFIGSTNLLLAPIKATAATSGGGWVVAAGGQTALLCNGCHGETTTVGTVVGNVNNPGTTQFYHPANAEAALPYAHDHARHYLADQATAVSTTTDPNIPTTGSFPIYMRNIALNTTSLAPTVLNANYVGTTTGEVLCTACHDVHGGIKNQMAIRYINEAGGTGFTDQLPSGKNTSVCVACHGGSTVAVAANAHHPGQSGVNYEATYGFNKPSWSSTADDLGDLTDGLSCPDCHVFQHTSGAAGRRATAHNW